jgi:hypothetical protein
MFLGRGRAQARGSCRVWIIVHVGWCRVSAASVTCYDASENLFLFFSASGHGPHPKVADILLVFSPAFLRIPCRQETLIAAADQPRGLFRFATSKIVFVSW